MTHLTKPETAHREIGSRSFVLGMLRSDGTVEAEDLYVVGEKLGFSVHQIRLVTARLVDEGVFLQQGRGRKASFRTTSRFVTLIEPEYDWLRLAYLQDAGESSWDGNWTLVSFSLEEERRAERNLIRELLNAMAAAPLAGGLYLHAHDVSHEVKSLCMKLGVVESVNVIRTSEVSIGGTTKPKQVAAKLWPLTEIANEYSDFIKSISPKFKKKVSSDPFDEIALAFETIAAFRSCIDRDPLLPLELLPEKWPGVKARELFRPMMRRLITAREAAGIPALLSNYDKLFTEIHDN